MLLHKGFGPLWHPDTPDAYKATVRGGLATRFGYLNDRLSGHEHLLASGYAVADAYAFTILNWTRFHDIDLAPGALSGPTWRGLRHAPRCSRRCGRRTG